MKKQERQKKILELLHERERIKIRELAEVLHASSETSRTDLYTLVSQALVIKEHGWARVNKTIKEIPLSYRSQEDHSIKKGLSIRAFQEVKDGQVLFIDGGSTIFAGIEALTYKKEITVVTDSFPVAAKCMENRIKTFFLGGEINELEQRTSGYFATKMLEHFRIDLAILGTLGIKDTDGFTTINMDGIALLRHVINQSKKVLVVCDKKRFEDSAAYIYAKFREVDILVTHPLLPEQKKMVAAVKTIIECPS